jgi:Holliday junction resolvase
MSEQKTQAKMLKWLNDHGFYTVKTIVSNKKGVPDIIACSPNGVFVAIEVKYGKNKATKLQEYNIKLIRDRKGFGIVCYDLDTLITKLAEEGIIDAKD